MNLAPHKKVWHQVCETADTHDLAEILALIEAAKKLPKTKDGVRVVQNVDTVWFDNPDEPGAIVSCVVMKPNHANAEGAYWSIPLDTCYSTREAIEAALCEAIAGLEKK